MDQSRALYAVFAVLLSPRRWRFEQLFTPRVGLPLSLAFGLLMPSEAAWSTFTYVFLLPTVLLALLRGWRPSKNSSLCILILTFWAWSAISISWDHDISGHGNSAGYWLMNAICTLAFLLCYGAAHDQEPRLKRWAISTLIVTTSINSTLSLVLFIMSGNWTARLTGWGVSKNPILGGIIIDMCIVLMMGRMSEKRSRAPYIVAIVPMLLFLTLGYSRAPLLTLGCALTVLCFGSHVAVARLGGVLLALTLLAASFWVIVPNWIDIFLHNLLARGTDCHITIWRTAWKVFLQNPLLGAGPSARLPILPHNACPAFPHPHDLYLSLLLYSGLVGFLLFWSCQIEMLSKVLKFANGFHCRLWLALMVIPLVSGLTDLSQVIKGPSAMWLIVWLPMLLISSLRPGQTNTS